MKDIFACPSDVPLQVSYIPTCEEEKMQVFHELRKAAFTNPKASPYWNALACIHKNEGLSDNAAFYQKLAQVTTPRRTVSEIRRSILESVKDQSGEQIDRLRFALSKDFDKYRHD